MSDEPLGALFQKCLIEHPDRPFIHHCRDDRVFTSSYADVAIEVARFVELLGEAGVARGDRVVLRVDDPIVAVYSALGCFHAEVVPAYVASSFSSRWVDDVAGRCHASTVVSESDLRSHVTRSRESLERKIFDASPSDLCLIQPTSGTTGRPKLVLTPHVSFTFGARAVLQPLSGLSDQRVLMASSITHGIGMVNLIGALIFGSALAVPSADDTAMSRDELLELSPTFVYTTPRVVRSLVGQYDSDETACGPMMGASVRSVVVAGAQADVSILERLANEGVAIGENYGSSEAGDLAVTPVGCWRAGWIGPPIQGVTLEVSGEGELLARSPGIMLGYEEDAEQTAERFTPDGAYRTGDLAEISTEDGFVRLLGRVTDAFNTMEGTNVYPERIERLVADLDHVAQVVLVGDQRPFLTALIHLTSPGTVAVERVAEGLADINSSLEDLERVRRFAILDRPIAAEHYNRTSHGKNKVDRSAIARLQRDRIEQLYAPHLALGVVAVPENEATRSNNPSSS